MLKALKEVQSIAKFHFEIIPIYSLYEYEKKCYVHY